MAESSVESVLRGCRQGYVILPASGKTETRRRRLDAGWAPARTRYDGVYTGSQLAGLVAGSRPIALV